MLYFYISDGTVAYLHQLSPEEASFGLLIVNCPGFYPEVLHVEDHRWKDGLAEEEGG